MYQLYKDYQEGLYASTITLKKLRNGFTEASADGLKVCNRDQEVAVNELQQKLRDSFISGNVTPVV
jgi:hypothetical protein